MAAHDLYVENISIPRAVRFPVELRPPFGFDPARPSTWPQVAGRLEYVDGRLWYMPPCGDNQQDTVTDIVITLGGWVRAHPDFILGTNEAGMILGGEVRAADAAVWRRADVRPATGGFRRVPPLLAVEVAGYDDPEDLLRDKARWYFAHGVATVWIVLPESREVVVLGPAGESRHGGEDTLPEPAGLGGLTPKASELFLQLG